MDHFYLARHATPDWTRTDLRYDLPPGPPLTAQGEAEAAQLGAYLRQAGVRCIFASPLERTQRTAHLAAVAAGLPVATLWAIREWERGEPEEAVLARMQQFWTETVLANGAAGPVAAITHGGPIRLFLQAMAVDPTLLADYGRQFDHANPLPPAGVWRGSRQAADEPWRWELVFTPVPVGNRS